ncbi:hypothetical protein BATDEDRAFT_85033 [Batrachochytrium dendrobatidis JAM81]|uniref:Golgi apparatus membrane protein TVP18 n=1 Tax=Batrachochytrium dendrobatidis (strain JAM81 / FGSC 10211) TaxID=684364 RepID=F4NT93_BATDJ|nr:uncharacterized protein BATDEDRAFT_85033 [Batrachochytrium dendrobatidis JAM81]EGF83491.1 hypothetical protein BATDEDRAFT_85033 [Batrachochytrium dendrobatidis JAM81]KAJ8327101.1 Golgi apparatus membrane protein tvp18 [Batrachochytrium dendrobatidis]KAK5667990.1 Golgi apparatus membrane protein tvp18 [Batrachochytrium dendrobatidis]|eukprot:XP_006676115.1 hypothetical protein BATDEDRAFT_85033 [Batrachochytrium dendrobatidis JAM81]
MTFVDDLKSGKCAIYGQFTAILTFLFLVIFGFFNLVSSLIIFSILGWVFAGIVFLVEMPFCAKCCANDNLKRVSDFFQANQFKACLYLVFSIVLWCSIRVQASTILVSATFMTFTTAFYAIAALRHEDPAKSSVNGTNLAVQATSTFGGRV